MSVNDNNNNNNSYHNIIMIIAITINNRVGLIDKMVLL